MLLQLDQLLVIVNLVKHIQHGKKKSGAKERGFENVEFS